MIDAATPTPEARAPAWRFWPDDRLGRIFVVTTSAAFVAYLAATMVLRFWNIFDPWSCDGDQPQAVWHYWRYAVDGAFRPGAFLTDYAFVMHAPPMWWAMMASLSELMSPIWAAKLLNLVVYVATCAAMYGVVATRSNHFVGLAAAFLLDRNSDFHGLTAGGYARSFGPLLVLAFLAVFLRRRHGLVLAVLILQAALYPSVVMPCGLAYGVYCLVAGPMKDRLRRLATLAVAGVVIIGFGKSQDIAAPQWWGPLVTIEEAAKMPAWSTGGRVHEVPLRPLGHEVERIGVRAFTAGGHVLLPKIGVWSLQWHAAGLLAVVLGVAAADALLLVRRRRRGQAFHDQVPWELGLMVLAAVGATIFSRQFAFKFYLPYRPLEHVLAYMFYPAIALSAWTLARNLLERRLVAALVAFAAATVPSFLVYGDGLDERPTTYDANAGHAKYYTFMRTLPLDATIAGSFSYVDRMQLFSWHSAYVTKNLAHPFRAGYFAEADRRIRVVYGELLYGTDLQQIVDTAKREHIDYLAYPTDITAHPDRKLFNPHRADLEKLFLKNQDEGFALPRAPASAVVYADGADRVLSIAKLEDALKRGDVTARPFIGPQLEP